MGIDRVKILLSLKIKMLKSFDVKGGVIVICYVMNSFKFEWVEVGWVF